MNDDEEFEIYLYISKNKLVISAFSKQSYINNLYKNELFLENSFNIDYNENLINFLDNNIYKIEKKINTFIKKINLVIYNNKFLIINLGVKKNLYSKNISYKEKIKILYNLKSEINKSYTDVKIIHFIIEKCNIDNDEINFNDDNAIGNYFFLEVKFICMPNNYLDSLERDLNKYLINIDKIVSFDYAKSLFNEKIEDECKIGMKVLNGFNLKEVFLKSKIQENKGFFYKFFNFFS